MYPGTRLVISSTLSAHHIYVHVCMSSSASMSASASGAAAPAPVARAQSRQAERSARTRSALLEAAARGLSRHGYGNLVLEQVAREAGYTRGALYHQFKDKEDLARAVLAWVDETWRREVGELVDRQTDPVSALIALARGHAVFCRRDVARFATALRLEFSGQRPSNGRGGLERVSKNLVRRCARLDQHGPQIRARFLRGPPARAVALAFARGGRGCSSSSSPGRRRTTSCWPPALPPACWGCEDRVRTRSCPRQTSGHAPRQSGSRRREARAQTVALDPPARAARPALGVTTSHPGSCGSGSSRWPVRRVPARCAMIYRFSYAHVASCHLLAARATRGVPGPLHRRAGRQRRRRGRRADLCSRAARRPPPTLRPQEHSSRWWTCPWRPSGCDPPKPGARQPLPRQPGRSSAAG